MKYQAQILFDLFHQSYHIPHFLLKFENLELQSQEQENDQVLKVKNENVEYRFQCQDGKRTNPSFLILLSFYYQYDRNTQII